MKLTQKEIRTYLDQNKPMIWQHKTLHQLGIFTNTKDGKPQYYARPIYKNTNKGQGVTLRGRYIAMSLEYANKFISNGYRI